MKTESLLKKANLFMLNHTLLSNLQLEQKYMSSKDELQTRFIKLMPHYYDYNLMFIPARKLK